MLRLLSLHLHLHLNRRAMNCFDYITARQLAERWGVHRATLLRWRQSGIGPAFHKRPGVVLYSLAEVEQYEQANPYLKPQEP